MLRTALALVLLFSVPARADVPRVAVDIAAVHGLVEQVLGDLGGADLILPPGASPHDFALRPSQAAALEQADIVIWIGPDLTPWLERSLHSLAADATQLRLLDVPGTRHLPMREGAVFSAEDHDHEHGRIDPHAWLDPANARVWLTAVAGTLAEADPDNAGVYRANAAMAEANLLRLESEIDTLLAPVRDVPFIVLHDAIQYFEARFGLHAIGAMSDSDATPPGAGRLVEMLDGIAERDVACLFWSSQDNIEIAFAVLESGLPNAVLDPVGMNVRPEPDFYTSLMRGMAETIRDCLSGS